MTRFLSILGAIFLLSLLIVTGVTDPEAAIKTFHLHDLIIHASVTVLFGLLTFLYCGFATLHAAQRVADPHERGSWIAFTLMANVFGSCVYYCTKYQAFREIGKGGLIRSKDKTKGKMFELSEAEKL